MPLRTTARMTALRPGQSPPPVRSPIRAIWRGSLRESDHRPDAVLLLHQLEAAVDLAEGQLVRQEGFDVDLAGEPALDQRRHHVAALEPAERAARDAPAGDQEAGDDLERLALPGHVRDRAQAPAHARGLDRLAHH